LGRIGRETDGRLVARLLGGYGTVNTRGDRKNSYRNLWLMLLRQCNMTTEDSYLKVSNPPAAPWSYEDWEDRREMLARVWEDKNIELRKSLLAVLIAHASEATASE
jgi:hypothetical protein